MSGVFYSVHRFASGHGEFVKQLLTINPGAVYVELARDALIEGNPPVSPNEWFYAVGWAVVVLLGGYVFFWQAEEQYGRV
jgi:teichoic acid transport system permease protein